MDDEITSTNYELMLYSHSSFMKPFEDLTFV